MAEISSRTGLYKSTILRLTESLVRSGYIVRMADKRFAAGPTPMILGSFYRRRFKMEAFVRPLLLSLVEQANESASFFRKEGNRSICLFRADCRHLIRDQIREGDVLSLDHHAAGQVLARFSLAKPRMRIALMAKIPFVSLGEGDSETATMAVPVFSGSEGLAGALAVSGPLTRFTPEKLVNMRPLLLEFDERLSTSLASSQYLQARS
ncbi:helix-turn-helix domain-containing protein [Mesorhizobium sp. M0700]